MANFLSSSCLRHGLICVFLLLSLSVCVCVCVCVLQSSADYARASDGFERLAQRRLGRLKTVLGVTAVLSTAKPGNRVKMFARQLGIDLLFCPCEREMQRLCAAFGILLSSEANLAAYWGEGEGKEGGKGNGKRGDGNANGDDNGGLDLLVGVARELRVLSKDSALILGATPADPATSATPFQTILLCAPTPALCSQYERLVAETIRVVAASIGSTGDNSDGGGRMSVIPGACLVEKRLVWLIDGFLAGGGGRRKGGGGGGRAGGGRGCEWGREGRWVSVGGGRVGEERAGDSLGPAT